jgi:hypothetical protein
MANFAITDPVAAARLHPIPAAMLRQNAIDLEPILHPSRVDLGLWIAAHTPDEQEEIKKAIEAILLP